MTFLYVCLGLSAIVVALTYMVKVCMSASAQEDQRDRQEAERAASAVYRPTAYLLLDDKLGRVMGCTDGERALEYAETTGMVVALVPLSADFRTPVDSDG